MFSTLTHRPVIGIVSGLGSGVLLTVQQIVIDEKILPVVGAIGVWAGTGVAVLTVILKFIELVEKAYSKYKRKSI